MPGRFIGTNVRSVQDCIDYLNDGHEGVILFLDFKKAFDSVSHVFLFRLMEHMGFSSEFVSWIRIRYRDSISCVKFKNWLTPVFEMKRGVRQGCPISCHLFNLVGQVLVYSLCAAGLFAWWTYSSDPCSLYADDGTLFIPDLSKLSEVISHIQGLTKFTGLSLNLDKTIIFNPKTHGSKLFRGMRMQGTPVKYLGTFVGSGNLARDNFELTLRKARLIAAHWNKRNLTLPARVLICKTFIFSTFVHICNCCHITTSQIELLQKILNEFLWCGRNRIRTSVMYAPVSHGGLNMIKIKSIMCTLHVKWMNRLCTDAGTTWSRIIWPKIKNVIPTNLISGLTGITEQSLNSLPQFYRSIIRSYVHVNNLFYLENKDLSLPYNLFGTQLHPRIRPRWVEMGLLCAADLPLKGK